MMGISFFRRPVGSAIEHFRPTFSAERKILQLSRYPFDGNDCRTPRPSLPSYSSRGCLSRPRRRDDASCCQHAISGNAPYHPPIGRFLHGVCSPFGFLTAYFHEKPVLLSIRHRPSGHAGSFLPDRIGCPIGTDQSPAWQRRVTPDLVRHCSR